MNLAWTPRQDIRPLDEELVTNVERPTSAVQATILMKMTGQSDTSMHMVEFVDPTADADQVVAQALRTLGMVDYDVEERWFRTFGVHQMGLLELSRAHYDATDPYATGDHHVRSSH